MRKRTREVVLFPHEATMGRERERERERRH